MDRVVVDVPESLAWADWEDMLTPLARGRLVVRSFAARPSYSGLPLQPPLRVLEVVTSAAPMVREWIDHMVHHARAQYPGVSAIEVADVTPADAAGILAGLGWPVADVIHLDAKLLDAAGGFGDQAVGSPGWLEKFTRLAQCRLLVVPAYADDAGPVGLADRLTRRGGPAVVVTVRDDNALRGFYEQIIHDEPVDAAARALPPGTRLFLGEGREEGVRVSAAVEAIVADPSVVLAAGEGIEYVVERMRMEAPQIDYRWSERLGLFPMTRMLEDLRSHPGLADANAVAAEVVEPGVFVNASLHDGDVAVPPTPKRPLRVGRRFDLRVDIGPLEEATAPAMAAALLFERGLWEDVDEGLWFDVGVTAVGWEVLGEPVQRLFLAKGGESTPCWFALRPLEAGVPLLRFTLYREGHIIQSFRLGAVVGDDSGGGESALATALALDVSEVAAMTWRARLEFSTVVSIDEARDRKRRALTIVANDADGKTVLTFKTAGEFEVRVPGNVDEYVQGARIALEGLTFNARAGNIYRFGADNAGTEAWFTSEVVTTLAKAGAALYDQLVPLRVRATLPSLGGVADTVQVASMLREKVVPWALVYQGKYDPDLDDDGAGNPIGHAACTALVGGGKQWEAPCGTLPDCVLHPDQLRAREQRGEPFLRDETVACPGRFWGFRHRIEVPPLQSSAGGSPPATDVIATDGELVAALAFSDELGASKVHRDALREAITAKPNRVVREADRRDAVIAALGEPELALVYMFCTANGGPHGPLPPELLFAEPVPAGASGEFTRVPVSPSVLADVVWQRHPLVVLNGCGTAGFSPKAVSEFITAFVDDREASYATPVARCSRATTRSGSATHSMG